MAHQISHPFDDKCPYCTRSIQDHLEEKRKKDKERLEAHPSGVIPGSQRVRFRPLDDGKEQMPSWANPDIQPAISLRRLTKPSSRTQK